MNADNNLSTTFNEFLNNCHEALVNKGFSLEDLKMSEEYFIECFENKVPLSLTINYYSIKN